MHNALRSFFIISTDLRELGNLWNENGSGPINFYMNQAIDSSFTLNIENNFLDAYLSQRSNPGGHLNFCWDFAFGVAFIAPKQIKEIINKPVKLFSPLVRAMDFKNVSVFWGLAPDHLPPQISTFCWDLGSKLNELHIFLHQNPLYGCPCNPEYRIGYRSYWNHRHHLNT